jgi:CheY-like chemotaxis protein/HPt (histidine-containing phosphotransfer) domain-containing protein
VTTQTMDIDVNLYFCNTGTPCISFTPLQLTGLLRRVFYLPIIFGTPRANQETKKYIKILAVLPKEQCSCSGFNPSGFKIKVVNIHNCLRKLQRKCAYDAVVIDMTLPDVYESLKLIKESNCELPVFALQSEKHDPGVPLRSGATKVIYSPIHVEHLITAVEKAIEREPYKYPLEMEAGLEQCCGDEQFYMEMCGELVVTNNEQLQIISTLIGNKDKLVWDWDNIFINAYSLKGENAQLRALPLSHACFSMSKIAKNRKEEKLAERFHAMTVAFHKLKDYVDLLFINYYQKAPNECQEIYYYKQMLKRDL